MVVEHTNPTTKVARNRRRGPAGPIPDTNEAEVALLVSDATQRHGIGTELASCLVNIAREEKIGTLLAWTSRDNHPMQRVLQKSGFIVERLQLRCDAVRADDVVRPQRANDERGTDER